MPTFWVRAAGGDRSVEASGDEISIGRAEHADVHVEDRRVSRAHCEVRRVADVWLLRDLGSANGTFLNGVRVQADQTLNDRDVIRIGDSSIVVSLPVSESEPTEVVGGAQEAPRLTPREQEVLEVLCAPLFGTDPFAEPRSVREIAAELHVTPDAIKKVLTRLYDKFSIHEEEGTRRVLLARAAVLSQSVRPPSS